MTAEQLATIADETEERTPLPEGWCLVRLGDIADIVNGFGFTETLQGKRDLPFPFIKVSDMNAADSSVTVSKAANTVDESMLKTLRARTYPAGTIIFPKVGGALLTNKKRILGTQATFDNNIMGVVPKSVEKDWLYYWMLTVDLKTLANTQALPSIRQSDVSNLEIPLPPTAEDQRRIAAVLDEQIKAVEQARRAVEEQIEAAKLLLGAILRSVFESEEAQDWQKRKLGEFLTLRKEVVHPRDNPKGKVFFVGLEHIESGTGRRIGALEVEKEQLTGRKPQFYKDDIVYGYLRPYLNKLWIAEFEGLCSVDQYVYSVNTREADLKYLAYFMLSPVYLETAPIDATPGQLPRIRTEEVATVELRLPPLERQRKIVEELNDQMQAVETLNKSLTEQLEAIEKMPAALLRKAFAGEV